MNHYSGGLVALAATMVLILQPNILAHAQMFPAQLFGCQKYGGAMHCDLLMNKMDAYEETGNSTLIHPLTTSDTLFVEGKLGRGLEMRAEYREYYGLCKKLHSGNI